MSHRHDDPGCGRVVGQLYAARRQHDLPVVPADRCVAASLNMAKYRRHVSPGRWPWVLQVCPSFAVTWAIHGRELRSRECCGS
jgi:hypothetical protein